ncbi:MAG: glycosyltransferase family 2 protein [Microthrixaceae bacterium]
MHAENLDTNGPGTPVRPETTRRRRQLGGDRRTEPLAPVAPPPSRRAISAARFAIVFTILAWAAYAVDQTRRLVDQPLGFRTVLDTLTYTGLVTLLTASALAYLLTRLGYLYRIQHHQRAPRATIDAFFASRTPGLTAIVPSYREDRRVIRQTLLSTALQEYPDLRVVLLIDDPVQPDSVAAAELLEGARSLPGEIEALLDAPARRFADELARFEHGSPADDDDPTAPMAHLADLYDEAAAWFAARVAEEAVTDHADQFLVDQILGRLGREMSMTAEALRQATGGAGALSRDRLLQLHRRLAWTFRAEVSSFERKRFASLSHEPNKAMNLNSYIGLMGRRFRLKEMPAGPVLLEVGGDEYDLDVPDPDYVLTLDADSMLLPEYCLRLVHLLEQPEAADIAVAQTPYSAYPGARSRIERIAGATTDLQHLVHQGLARDNAAFWVGANAVLRKTALDEICEEEVLRGVRIRRYIQDRTPIEDTESSIDISLHGWKLYNFPERLSYSATPPDFGSLCVQRQRWANGGLLLVGKLRTLMRHRRATTGRHSFREGFLRLNYLASIAWASLGLIVLLVYPYDDRLISPIALLAAVPYLVALSTDLRRCGYRRTDALRIYGFNLLLLPVNTAGVLKSVEQSIGGQKIAFARTPKIRNRTIAPLSFVLVPYLIVLLSAYTLWRDVRNGNANHAVFAGSNAVLTLYAIVAFVGLRYSLVDIWKGVISKLQAPDRSPTARSEPDWVSVLYYGVGDTAAPAGSDPTVAALALLDQNPAEIELATPEEPITMGPVVSWASPEQTTRRTGLRARLSSLRSRLTRRNGRTRSNGRRGSSSADRATNASTDELLTLIGRHLAQSGGDLVVRVAPDDEVRVTVDLTAGPGGTAGEADTERRRKDVGPPDGVERRLQSVGS